MTINLVAYDLAIAGNISVLSILFGAAGLLLVYYIIKFVASIFTGG